jgi:cell division protein FtsB
MATDPTDVVKEIMAADEALHRAICNMVSGGSSDDVCDRRATLRDIALRLAARIATDQPAMQKAAHLVEKVLTPGIEELKQENTRLKAEVAKLSTPEDAQVKP